MAGLLSAGGGYRRTLLAVAVTGSVCAGVGLIVYVGVKKIRARKSASGTTDSTHHQATSLDEQEPSGSHVSQEVKVTSETTEPEPAPQPSVDETVPSEQKTPVQPPAPASQPKPEDQPKSAVQPNAEAQLKPEGQPKPEDQPKPEAQPKSEAQPKLPAQPLPAAQLKPEAQPKAESQPKLPTQPSTPKEPAVPAPQVAPIPPQPKTPAPKAVPSAQPVKTPPVAEEKTEKLKEVKDKIAETVKDSTEKAQEKGAAIASKVESLAAEALEKAKGEISALPTEEKVVTDVENVVKAKAEEAIDSVPAKASGDGPTSLSSMDSRLDSDIIVIDESMDASDVSPGRQVGQGSGDAHSPVASSAPSAEIAFPELPSGGLMSSLGDDIEIIHDSPASTDTTDTTDSSGDFVKCDRSLDLSQSIEIIKVPKAEERQEGGEKDPQTSTKVESGQEGSASQAVIEDSNANFQSPVPVSTNTGSTGQTPEVKSEGLEEKK